MIVINLKFSFLLTVAFAFRGLSYLASLSIAPLSLFLHFIFSDKNTFTVLFAVFPEAFIVAAIRPGVDTKAFFSIVDVFTFKRPSITPSEGADAMHLVIDPLTIELTIVSPLVNSSSTDVVFTVVTEEVRAIDKFKTALSILEAITEATFVIRLIWPNFSALPMLLIEGPLTFVLSPVHVEILSLAMGHVVEPVAKVHATVIMDEATLPISFIVFPPPLVLGPILPELHSFARPLTLLVPLSLVDSSIIKFIGAFINQVIVNNMICLFIVEWPMFLLNFLCDVIHVIWHFV
jgi:hypothetical protein